MSATRKDLYRSEYDPIADTFGPPTSLNTINDGSYNIRAYVTTDSDTMLFTSDRPGGGVAYDIWMSTWNGSIEDWNAPTKPDWPINSVGNDYNPWWSPARDTLYFTRSGVAYESHLRLPPETQVVFWPNASGGNDHFYKFIPTPTPADAARTAAETMNYFGSSGNLASISSAEENEFVADVIENAGSNKAWIGLTDVEDAGTWKWTDDPDTVVWQNPPGYSPSGSFVNWNRNPPNGPQEPTGDGDLVHLTVNAAAPVGRATWNDEPSSSRMGYVVEFWLLSDVNWDGVVNGLDVDPFVDVLLNGPYQVEADMNQDGVVNGLDVDLFVAAVVGIGTQAVPEPSTILMMMIGLLAMGAVRRR